MQKFASQKKAWQKVGTRLSFDLLAVATHARPAVLLDYIIISAQELGRLVRALGTAAPAFKGQTLLCLY